MRSALHNIDIKTAETYLKQFAELDSSHTGEISKDDFLSIIKHEPGSDEGFREGEVERLFALLDVEGNGTLNFREFLTVMTFTNGEGHENQRDALRLTFRVFDTEDSGSISTSVLADVLHRGLPNVSQEEIEKMAAGADKDGDGRVSFDDFLAFAEAHSADLPTIRSHFFAPKAT
jgi:Ca2+-binding EF-hand superfamily protein